MYIPKAKSHVNDIFVNISPIFLIKLDNLLSTEEVNCFIWHKVMALTTSTILLPRDLLK